MFSGNCSSFLASSLFLSNNAESRLWHRGCSSGGGCKASCFSKSAADSLWLGFLSRAASSNSLMEVLQSSAMSSKGGACLCICWNKKRPLEQLFQKTTEEEVTDNHEWSGNSPLKTHHLPKMGWSMTTEHVTAQNTPFLKSGFYHKFKNSKQLQASLEPSAIQIHQISVPPWKNQRIKFARFQFLSAISKQIRQVERRWACFNQVSCCSNLVLAVNPRPVNCNTNHRDDSSSASVFHQMIKTHFFPPSPEAKRMISSLWQIFW